MAEGLRPKSEQIREYIFRNLKKQSLAAMIVNRFGISRQAANSHLRNLVKEGAILASGKTSNRTYRLAHTSSKQLVYKLRPGLEEDIVWRNDIRPLLEKLPANVLNIWHWAFTEMFNNAIDHSAGQKIIVSVRSTARHTEIIVQDDGVGIFKKIQKELGLEDERQAVFELSKGKLTTDSKRHSGQGIFFTSRMVNQFRILSEGVYFSHEIQAEEDWIMENKESATGTAVFMTVDNHTARTTKKILDSFSVKGSYGFNKTVVPVEMARYGSDQLISRSQAKRVLARVDLFSQVLFDFAGIEEIGQAFADEIFRVFASEHPAIELMPINASKNIVATIGAARKSARAELKEETRHARAKLRL